MKYFLIRSIVKSKTVFEIFRKVLQNLKLPILIFTTLREFLGKYPSEYIYPAFE